MKTNTKNIMDAASRETQKLLGPLIKYAQANKGTVARVTVLMQKLTGQKCHRQLVEAWLHHDENKRTEPRLGTGLLLARIWESLKNERSPKHK